MEMFTSDEQEQITHAISRAESLTSGEIRVVIEYKVGEGKGVMEKASYYFQKLEMHNTIQRNGVLIYIAFHDQVFCVLGDVGIHKKVGDDFWEEVRNTMLSSFRKGQVLDGLKMGVKKVGEILHGYFPKGDDDINELPNDIYFGDKNEGN